jgi:protein-tyrosine phosphatase
MIHLSFVCLGNICRSPTAEAVMRSLIAARGWQEHIAVESAGTGDYHVGSAADSRSRAVGKRRGYALDQKAKQFLAPDFERVDYVLAMDFANRDHLLSLAPNPAARAKVRLLRSFVDPERDLPVPDPYFGGAQGFEEVLDVCEEACAALLRFLEREHGPFTSHKAR